MRRIALTAGLIAALSPGLPTLGHDIPNARVDRATQVTVTPGQLTIDYEVSLSELTLTQELRSLIGTLPGAGREDWLNSYGRETGPLNAKGFLVTVDGEELPLRTTGFDVVVEQHPSFTFRFEAALPDAGQLSIRDTNFASSEGTCRLALRGAGVAIEGSELPADVTTIPPRELWMLTDEEERRTRSASVRFGVSPPPAISVPATRVKVRTDEPVGRPRPSSSRTTEGLAGLLETKADRPTLLLVLLAGFLGGAHALLPGHGKTLVVASVLGDRGGWLRGAFLALVTAVTHLGSVFLVALGLWWTHSTRFAAWDDAIGRASGFLIASVAFWRLGRWSGGHAVHEHPGRSDTPRTLGGLLAIGIGAGAVPCWDAVALVVFASAVGKLGLALTLLLAFSAGLGLVLAAVSYLATRFRESIPAESDGRSRGLLLASSLVLGGLGLYLLYRPG